MHVYMNKLQHTLYAIPICDVNMFSVIVNPWRNDNSDRKILYFRVKLKNAAKSVYYVIALVVCVYSSPGTLWWQTLKCR